MIEFDEEKNRSISLDDDEELIRVNFYMPKKLHRALKRIAVTKERSASSIAREGIEKELRYLEANPLTFIKKKKDSETIISNDFLVEILNSCTSFFGGFEIDNEGGFVNYFETNDLKLKNLNSDQWEAVYSKIQIGFDGYEPKPNEKTWLAKFEKIKPSKEQLKDLMYERKK